MMKKDKKKENWFANFVNKTFTKKQILEEVGIKHLLIDLPSVDKEKDEGKSR